MIYRRSHRPGVFGCWLGLALLAVGLGAAQASQRIGTVLAGGGVRFSKVALTNKASCAADPNARFTFSETADHPNLMGGNIDIDERDGSVSVGITVTVLEVCDSSLQKARFSYDTVNITAIRGTDFTNVRPAVIDFPTLAAGTTANASLALDIILDSSDVDQQLGIGLQQILLLDSRGAGVIDASNAPFLVTVTIKRDTRPDEDQTRDEVGDIAARNDDPVVDDVGGTFAAVCARDPGAQDSALQTRCNDILDALGDAPDSDIADAIRALVPDEVAVQGSQVVEVSNVQLSNISGRLAALRGGATGISVAGLSVDAPGSMGVAATTLMGSALSALASAAGEEPGGGLLDERWGAFFTGSISFGNKSASRREQGFDFDTQGITAGIDYRFTDHFVAGLGFGYSHFNSDLNQNAGDLDTNGWSTTAYATYFTDNYYFDASVAYGQANFDQTRAVRYTLRRSGGAVSVDELARGSTDTDSVSGSLGYGYQFSNDQWTFGPVVRLEYTHARIESFTESGAGEFNLQVQGRSVASLLLRSGLVASYANSVSWGVIVPQLEVNYLRDTHNGGGFVRASLVSDTGGNVFSLATDESDQNFANASVSVNFVTLGGNQFFISYDRVFGLARFNQNAFFFGGRIEF